MAAARMAVSVLFAIFAIIQQAAGVQDRAHATAGLRGTASKSKSETQIIESAAAPAEISIAETLKALDTNGDGKVDKSEIQQFAKSQGLSMEEVSQDFQDLDRNRNGELEASEIGTVLAETETIAEPATPEAALHTEPVAAQVTAPVATRLATPEAAQVATAARVHEAVTKEEVPPPQVAKAAEVAAAPVVEVAAPALVVTAPKREPPSQHTEAPLSTEQSAGELNLEALQQDAERQAGSVLAETVAREAQQMFEQGKKDEERAAGLEQLAKSIRGNMTAISRSASSETKRAAQEATAKVANGAAAEVRRLSAEADRTEREAAQRRSNAQAAMQRVMKAQAAMADSTRLLSDGLA